MVGDEFGIHRGGGRAQTDRLDAQSAPEHRGRPAQRHVGDQLAPVSRPFQYGRAVQIREKGVREDAAHDRIHNRQDDVVDTGRHGGVNATGGGLQALLGGRPHQVARRAQHQHQMQGKGCRREPGAQEAVKDGENADRDGHHQQEQHQHGRQPGIFPMEQLFRKVVVIQRRARNFHGFHVAAAAVWWWWSIISSRGSAAAIRTPPSSSNEEAASLVVVRVCPSLSTSS